MLDTALVRLASSRRTYNMARWVRYLYPRVSTPKDVLIARLVLRGILRQEEERILWVFPITVYPAANSAPEHRVRQQLRDAALDGENLDARCGVFFSLLHGCRLLSRVLSKGEMKEYKNRIQSLYENSAIGYAVGKAVASVIAEDEATAAMSATVAAVS